MATEIPIVRHFIACQELVLPPSGLGIILRDPVHTITRLPDEPAPFIREMAVYAVLTNGRGEHSFYMELTILRRGQVGMEAVERGVFQTSPVRRDLGQDPTEIMVLPLPKMTVGFPRVGQYTLYLHCDGRTIGHAHLEVR